MALNTTDKKLYSSNGSAVFLLGNHALANTNLAITNVKTGLTTTNTALRLLINDRLQVANAASIYQTKAVERAALANTNNYIATKLNTSTFNSALANTNTYIATKASSTNPTTSGLLAHTGRATISTNLTVSGNTTLGAAGKTITSTGVLTHTGNLTVSGNTSTNKATVTSALTVSGNTTLGAAGKTITTTGAAAHTGTKTISTNLTVSGNTTLGAAGKTITTTGVLAHTGNLTVSGNTSTNKATVTSALTVSGNTVIGKLLANNSLGTAGYALKTNGSTVFWGAVGAGGSSGATWAALTSTNTAIRLLVSDRLQVANAVTLYATKAGPTTSGLLAHTGRATISTNLTVSGNTTSNKSTVTSSLISSGNTVLNGGLSANGSFGTANYVLKTNGAGVFWATAASGGSDTSKLAVANSFVKLTSYSSNTHGITQLANNVISTTALTTNPAGHITLLLPNNTTIKIAYWL